MFTAIDCAQVGGVDANLIGNKYCAKTDCVAATSADGHASFSCTEFHDRLAIPSTTSPISLKSAKNCTQVARVLLPSSRISRIYVSFFDGFPNMHELDLSDNQLTTMFAGFTSRTRSARTIRLAANWFSSECAGIVVAATGTSDMYCEAYVAVNMLLQRAPGIDQLTLKIDPEESHLLTSTLSYTFGASPPVAMTTDQQVLRVNHSMIALGEDGQIASLQMSPKFEHGISPPLTFNWTLSIAPPVAYFASTPTTPTSQKFSVIDIFCNRPGCSLNVYHGSSLFASITPVMGPTVSFYAAPIDAVAMSLTSRARVLALPLPKDSAFSHNGGHREIVGGGAAAEATLLNLTIGRHELVVRQLQGNGVQQPCPLGVWWVTDWRDVLVGAPTMLRHSWIGLHSSSDLVSLWKACTGHQCQPVPLIFGAFKLPNGCHNVSIEVQDAFGRTATQLSRMCTIEQPRLLDNWRGTGHVAVSASTTVQLPLQPDPHALLEYRQHPMHAWTTAPVPFTVPNGLQLLQLRYRNAALASHTTTVAWATEECSASAAIEPRLVLCTALPASHFCLDEPVFAELRSSCATSLEMSLNGGPWVLVLPGPLTFEGGQPGDESAEFRWAASQQGTAVQLAWSRSAQRIFHLQLSLRCAPPEETGSPAATFCVHVDGWMPPDCVLEQRLDGGEWKAVYSPAFRLSALRSGLRIVDIRAWHPRQGTLASLRHSWTVHPNALVPWLVWRTVPNVLSWAAVDRVAWESPVIPVDLFNVSLWNGTQLTTEQTFLDILAAQRDYEQRCISVSPAEVSASDPPVIRYCWWSFLRAMDITIARSNGGAHHAVFDIAAPVQILWQPVAADSVARSLEYRLIPRDPCSAASVTEQLAVAPDFFTVLLGLQGGWYTLHVRGVGLSEERGPWQQHEIFLASGLPGVVLQKRPPFASLSPTAEFRFSNATPCFSDMYWFECNLVSVEPGCVGGECHFAWRRCLSPLSVGPLAVGTYRLRIRTADEARAIGPVNSWTWTVQSSSISSVVIPDLQDGHHQFSVLPVDVAGKIGSAISARVDVDTRRPNVTTWLQPPAVCVGARCYIQAQSVMVLHSTMDLPRSPECSDCELACAVTRCSADTCARSVGGCTAPIETSQEGDYEVLVSAADPANNSATAAPIHFVVDRSAPSTVLRMVSEFRMWNTSVLVSRQQLQLNVSSEPWATVAVYVQEVLAVTWDFQAHINVLLLVLLNKPDGLWQIRAAARDAAGNVESGGALLDVLLDTTPPVSSGQLVGANVTSTGSIQLTAGGSDTCTDVTAWHIWHRAPDGTGQWVNTSTADVTVVHFMSGLHSAKVHGVDAAGNYDGSGYLVHWVVDRQPPVTWCGYNGSTVTNHSVIRIALGGSDSHSWIEHWIVLLSSPLGSVRQLQSSAHFVSIPLESDGRNVVTVYAVDAADNVDVVGCSIEVVLDRSAPVSSGQLVGPLQSNSTSVRLLLAASDAGPHVVGWRLAYYFLSPGAIGRGPKFVFAMHGEGAATIEDLRTGRYGITCHAVDTAGNEDLSGVQLEWTIDQHAPTGDVYFAGDAIIATRNTSVVVAATDRDTGVQVFLVSHEGSLASFSRHIDVDIATHVVTEIVLWDLHDGPHLFQFQAVDAVGNVQLVAIPTVGFTVDCTEPETLASFIGASLTNRSWVHILLGGHDATSEVVKWQVVLRDSDHMPGFSQLMLAPAGHELWLQNLTQGAHTIVVHAYDAAGNRDPRGVELQCTIDLEPPMTTVRLLQPEVSNSSTMHLAVFGTDAISAIKSVSLVHFGPFAALPAVVDTSVDGSAEVLVEEQIEGVHMLWLRAVDEVGWQDPTGVWVTWLVDTSPPQSLATLVGQASPVSSPTVSVNVSSVDAWTDVVCWYVRHVAPSARETLFYIVSSERARHAHAVIELLDLDDGPHTVQVVAQDAAGNVEAIPVSLRLLVDCAAPTTSVVVVTGDNLSVRTRAVSIALGGQDATTAISAWFYEHLLPSAHLMTGQWTQPNQRLQALEDGWHALKVCSCDEAGNRDPNCALARWLVDSQPPSTTAELVHPVFRNRTRVQVKLGGHDFLSNVSTWQIVHGRTAVNVSTPLYTSEPLQDGSHLFLVFAVDAAGNVDTTGTALSVVIDTEAPRAVIARYPPSLTNSSALTATVNCSESGIVQVQLTDVFLATTYQALEVLCDASTSVRVQFTQVPDATYRIAARMTDLAGNLQHVVDVGHTIVVDSTPVQMLTVHIDGSQTGTSYVLRTRAASFSIHYLAVDSNDRPCTACIVRVTARSAHPVLLAEQVGATGSIVLPLVQDGNFMFQLCVIDEAGNGRDFEPSLLVTRDTSLPITNITWGSVANGTMTNDTRVALELHSSKHEVSFHIADVEGDSPAVVLGATNGSTTLQHIASRDGLVCVAVRSIDGLGNAERHAAVWCRIVDTVAPSPMWARPPVALTDEPVVSGVLDEALEVGSLVTMHAMLGGATSRPSESHPCNQLTCSILLPMDGTWLVWLSAVDLAGNRNLHATNTAVHVTVDTTPPSVSVVTARPQHHVSAHGNWSAVLSVFDQLGIEVHATVNRIQGGPWPVHLIPISADGRQWQIQASNLSDGDWLISVNVTDVAGNRAPPWLYTWRVDTTAPVIAHLVPPGAVLNASATYPPLYTNPSILLQVICSDEHSSCTSLSRWYRLELFVADACSAGSTESTDWANAAQPLAGLLDGRYDVDARVVDSVGNERLYPSVWTFALDTTVPIAPKIEGLNVVEGSAISTTSVQLRATSNDVGPLPQLFRLAYSLNGAERVILNDITRKTSSSDGLQVEAIFSVPCESDGVYTLTVWGIDAASHVGDRATFVWSVQTAAPDTVIDNRPPTGTDIGVGLPWHFHFNSTLPGQAAAERIEILLDESKNWQSVCAGPAVFRCTWPIALSAPGVHSMQVRAVNGIGIADETPARITWNVKRCAETEMIRKHDESGAIECVACPAGSDCDLGQSLEHTVIALPGFWAESQRQTFYPCPLLRACAGGKRAENASSTVAECAEGYTGIMCSMCQDGYYLQFDQCSQCPADKASAWAAMMGLGAALMVLAGAVFLCRRIVPQTVLKIALAMIQIVGSANTSVRAPWPQVFVSLVSGLKVFMLELLTLTRTSCAVPVTFWVSFNATVFGMFGVSVALICTTAVLRAVQGCQRRRKGLDQDSRSLTTAIVRPLFTFWLLCYPGVSLKLFQVFDCTEVEGAQLLTRDLRLACYDSTWITYAIVSGLLLIAFTVGFPLSISVFLYRRRHDITDVTTLAEVGFLYEQYGPDAYAWEAVELLRKLLLTSGLTLMDDTSPLPLTVAVLISAFAHVLHAAYKPFVRRAYYMLQHGSLTVTTMVFTIGLMCKVSGVDQDDYRYLVFAVLLIGMCFTTFGCMVVVGIADVIASVRTMRRRAVAKPGRSSLVSRAKVALTIRRTEAAEPAVPRSQFTVELSAPNPLYRRAVAVVKRIDT